MRKIILPILTLVLLIGAFNPTHAQDDPLLWFWATTPEGLVAYTFDGQINPLFEDTALYELRFRGIRLTDDTALFYDEESRVIYLATPTTLTGSAPLDEQFDLFRPLQYRHPYLVFTGARVLPAAGILNIETMEFSPLSGFVGPNIPPIVFVDDTTLRYYSYADSAPGRDTSSTLWERNLATGEETALLTFEYSSFAVFYSQDGDQWWIQGLYNPDLGSVQQVTTYGNVDPAITSLFQNLGTSLAFDIVLTFDPFCEVGCRASITPLADGKITTFPIVAGSFLRIAAHSADGSLLIVREDDIREVFRLDSSGEMIELGTIDATLMALPSSSKDGRWVLTLGHEEDAETTYRLWNLETGQLVYEASLGAIVSAAFAEDVVLILNAPSFVLYDSEGDSVYDLSAHAGRFYQPLIHAQTLYEPSPDSDMAQGVYLYDAPSDAFTQLVPEGRGIRLAELN